MDNLGSFFKSFSTGNITNQIKIPLTIDRFYISQAMEFFWQRMQTLG